MNETITTLAELEDLPLGAIVKRNLDRSDTWIRRPGHWLWVGSYHTSHWVWNNGHLPVQLIYTPFTVVHNNEKKLLAMIDDAVQRGFPSSLEEAVRMDEELRKEK